MLMAAMFIIAGSLATYAVIVNADWFFRSPNVRILTGRMRRGYQRTLYGIIAAAMFALAIKLILESNSL